MEPKAACWEPAAGASLIGDTSPSGHELHTFKSVHFWVQKHWVLMFAGDKCCFMLCSLHGYSASASQAASSAGSSGTPGNLQGGGWALSSYGAGLERELGIPRQAPEFPDLAFVKGNSWFLPTILPSSLSLPHVCNWHHYLLSGSSPKPKSHAWRFSVPCLPFRSVPAWPSSKCIWKSLFPFPPTIHPFANKNDSPTRGKASGQTIIQKDTCTVVLIAAPGSQQLRHGDNLNITRRADEGDVVHTFNGMLLSLKRKG